MNISSAEQAEIEAMLAGRCSTHAPLHTPWFFLLFHTFSKLLRDILFYASVVLYCICCPLLPYLHGTARLSSMLNSILDLT